LNVVAEVKATNLFGSTVKTFRHISVPALLPGSVSSITEPVTRLPHLGTVNYQIALRATGASATANVQAWLIPWVLVVIVLLVVLLVVALLWRRHRRGKVPPTAGESTTAPRSPAPTPARVG
jgi:hypothetical protein